MPKPGDLKVWWIPQVPGKAFEQPDLKVWWIPQVPGKAFEQPVESFVEAKLLLDTLGLYDLFQLENNIKGDYSNAGGLQVYESVEEGWVDWHPTEKQEMILDHIAPEIGFFDDGLDKLTLEQVRVFQDELDIFINPINGVGMSVAEVKAVALKTGQPVMTGYPSIPGAPRVRKFKQKRAGK
jgi:hypothetical protein